ncbi:MAG: thioredoxin [Proteobacteria bacterium]|nr:thioredoxin [Pseudomonadota bacterium]
MSSSISPSISSSGSSLIATYGSSAAQTRVTAENFDREVVASTQPVIVDFWAPRCGPCRLVARDLAALENQYDGRVRVVKTNVDDEPELAMRFAVRSIPTLLALVDGQVVRQMVGYSGKSRLEALFSELVANR